MHRHNSFRLIHKALRTMLYDTSLRIQRVDLTSVDEGTPLMADIELLIALFDTHAHSEDTHFNEPLEKLKPEVATLFEKEHEEDHRLGNALTDIISQWRSATNDQARAAAGEALFFAFNEYLAFNIYHMNKEETLLNETIWSVYTDEQIIGIEQQIVQSVPPEKMGEYAKWIFRGNNNADIAHWISGIKMGAPAEVFGWIQGLAQQELSLDRYNAVMSNVQ